VIVRTEVLVLTHRLSRTRLFGTGSNVTRDSVVVRLEDGDGPVGWGETYLVPGVVEAARAMTEELVGRDADAAAAELTARPDAHRWALGAVSMALDDLRARCRGIPVSDLYGERRREQVRAYASSRGYLGGLSPEAAWTDEVATTWEDGFRAMKLRIGRYPLDDEIAAIERVVAAAPLMTWMADGNGAYDLEESRRLAAALEALRFRWLEEPLPTDDYLAYAPLASELTIPLAGGEILESAGAAAPPSRSRPPHATPAGTPSHTRAVARSRWRRPSTSWPSSHSRPTPRPGRSRSSSTTSARTRSGPTSSRCRSCSTMAG
jgi:D-galactarolactone cycloisomerase